MYLLWATANARTLRAILLALHTICIHTLDASLLLTGKSVESWCHSDASGHVHVTNPSSPSAHRRKWRPYPRSTYSRTPLAGSYTLPSAAMNSSEPAVP
jgi:hypothetical protein